MRNPTDKWENLLLATGSPDRVLLVGFKNDALKPLTGKDARRSRQPSWESPEETAMDLVIEDGSRVETIYFMMEEDNVRGNSRCHGSASAADEDFASTRGRVSDFKPASAGVRQFRALSRPLCSRRKGRSAGRGRPAPQFPSRANLSLDHRGLLKDGYFADVVVFNPATIQDHATFEKPHQYSTGVADVFVNGVQVLKDGEHTGAKPGRVVFGPGRAIR